ncbi:MAG: winged helix-turn-helix transcriptional regulator, partial [Candidatus Helarchaeota archaeon]|nr:winged helix-turn-helix transcriptional regulator [Candidatus Helarchaeota archaeon]
IKAQGQIRLTELADLLQISYTTIQPHLKDLEEGDLIRKIQDGRITYYTLAEVPPEKDLIEVKREYDYVGGKVRFKVAIRNFSDMAIHNISVNLNPSDQFISDIFQHSIANLPPNTTRGIDFDLIPLTCGQSKVFGSLSFEDAYGNAHSLTIQPKEISIKCPLVTPLPATQSEVNEWIKDLKRGTSKISYNTIPDTEAFRIGREQVNALDLKEITVNPEAMWGLYSGQVKVTGKNTIVKLSVEKPNIILDVWADDLKQTTGFIAYITNLVNIGLEVAYKMARKTEDVTKKIVELMKISSVTDEIITCCQKLDSVQTITTKLSNLQQLFQESFSESVLLSSIQVWNSKLVSMFEPNVPIEASIANELQYKGIQWLYKIQELIQTHTKMYQDAFDELTQFSDEFSTSIALIGQRIAEHEKNYGLGILSYLLILDNNSGIALFEKDLGDMRINPDLVGGFLHALQSFGREISEKESSMKTLTYENYQFQIENGEYVRAALILQGTPNLFLISRLKILVKKFEEKFKNHLINFTGNLRLFEPTNDLFRELFK